MRRLNERTRRIPGLIRYGIILLILLAVPAVSQKKSQDQKGNKPKAPVRLSRLQKHIQTLSSDEYSGREAGTRGAQKAAGYIVSKLKTYNVQPGIESSDRNNEPGYKQYFQFPEMTSVVTQESQTRMGTNVIGILPGSDPEVRDECIVVGAHYDGLGKGKSNVLKGRMRSEESSDDIWNGADDNASGTAAVLEIARILGPSSNRPDRTIVFAFFSAEEKGLYGSKHYIRHPARPLKKTVAMINFDMIGRNPDRKIQVQGIGSAGNWSLILSQLDSFDRRWIQVVQGLDGSSDHMPFLSNRIPSVFVTAGLHNDYHTVRDEADRISYKQVTLTTAFVLDLLTDLAQKKKTLVWNDEFGTGSSSANSSGNQTGSSSSGKSSKRKAGVGSSKRIGIFSYRTLTAAEARKFELGSGNGGIVILGLSKNSVGKKNGLQKGDVLYQLNGVDLPLHSPMEKLKKVLKEVKTGKFVPVRVYRNGKDKMIFLKW